MFPRFTFSCFEHLNVAFQFQKQVARLLFWGQQGMKRNIESAIQYYKMGAEAEDPQAMYDYGIVLLRVSPLQLRCVA